MINLLCLNTLKAINQRHSKAVIQIYTNFPALSYSQKKSNDGKVTDAEAAEKKRKKQIPKITLISDGDHVEISTLEEAQKLASRRNLKLVRIIDLDTKTQRPIYKLMTAQEYFAEDLKQREQKKVKKGGTKGEKLLTVSSKIASHDLLAKANLAAKWVQKNYEVRVIISRDGAENSKMEQIAKDIEAVAEKGGRIVQKRVSGSDIRFSMLPLKKEGDATESEDDSTKSTEAKSKEKTKDSQSTILDSTNKQQIRSFHSDSS